MTNNLGVEAHYTSMIRQATGGDSENYQQCNYQTFQMLVHSVVDQLNSKRRTLRQIFESFSSILQLMKFV